jgi:hypothetical protein
MEAAVAGDMVATAATFEIAAAEAGVGKLAVVMVLY